MKEKKLAPEGVDTLAPMKDDSGPSVNEIPGGDGRARLLMAGMRQIAQLGFDGVTVRSIAAEADVSIGLIKHHFGSKDGLRTAIDEHFLKRSGAAMDRALKVTHGMSVEEAAAYEVQWLEQYSEEWPDFVSYLRRAILEASPWGQKLYRRYFESIRHAVDTWDASGELNPNIDRLWFQLLYSFLLLGPLVMDPQIKGMLGKSTYEPSMWTRYHRAMGVLLQQGALHKDKKLS